jgi:hypothetical protein
MTSAPRRRRRVFRCGRGNCRSAGRAPRRTPGVARPAAGKPRRIPDGGEPAGHRRDDLDELLAIDPPRATAATYNRRRFSPDTRINLQTLTRATQDNRRRMRRETRGEPPKCRMYWCKTTHLEIGLVVMRAPGRPPATAGVSGVAPSVQGTRRERCRWPVDGRVGDWSETGHDGISVLKMRRRRESRARGANACDLHGLRTDVSVSGPARSRVPSGAPASVDNPRDQRGAHFTGVG